jgi:hypothetical protein
MNETPPTENFGALLTEEVTKICAEIPSKLNIVGILRDAHARLTAAAPDVPSEVIAEKVVDVLREITAVAVDEFTRRTGQPFLWVDEPDEPQEMLMSIGVDVKDGKGHVTF